MSHDTGRRRPRPPHAPFDAFLDMAVSPTALVDDLNQRIGDAVQVIEAGFRGDAGPLGAYRRQFTWVARLLRVPLAAERLAALTTSARAILERRGTLAGRGPDRIRRAAAECVVRLLTESERPRAHRGRRQSDPAKGTGRGPRIRLLWSNGRPVPFWLGLRRTHDARRRGTRARPGGSDGNPKGASGCTGKPPRLTKPLKSWDARRQD